MNKFTISFLTDKVEPFFVGGYEHQIFNLAKSMKKFGSTVVFTTMDKGSQNIDGIEFRKVISNKFKKIAQTRNLFHDFCFFLLLPIKIRKIAHKGILVIEAIPYIHLIYAPFFKWYTGSKLVLKVDEAWYSYTDIKGLIGKIELLLIRLLLKIGFHFSDYIIVNNNPTADTIVANYGIDRKKIIKAPFALDLKRLKDFPKSKIDKQFDLIFVGRLTSIKHVKDIILALELLKKKFSIELRTVIVGGGELLNDLNDLAKKLDVKVFFTGMVDETTKYSYLGKSKIFILPSMREGLSISTLEAQYFGLPCIVARPKKYEVFGPNDFILDGFNGLLYEAGVVEDLADKIFYLIHNPETFLRMTKNSGREMYKFDFDYLANELIERIQN